MEKYKFYENNGLWYELQGDYYLPCLKLPEEEQAYIGIWGQRHLRYLKEHRRVRYANLLTSGKLNGYLVDIDRQAEELFLRLVKQMAEREGVTEQLKAANSMEWVRKMNRHRPPPPVPSGALPSPALLVQTRQRSFPGSFRSGSPSSGGHRQPSAGYPLPVPLCPE